MPRSTSSNRSQGSSRWRVWILRLLIVLVLLGIGWYFFNPVSVVDDSARNQNVVIHAGTKTFDQNRAADDSTDPTKPPSLTAQLTAAEIAAAEHPFDPLLKLADQALIEIDSSVRDYTATLNSQVFADNQLQPPKTLQCKIRHARQTADGKQIPFSVYTKFVQPANTAGQEVIWVDGWHDGNLVVHLSGWGNLMNFYLDPDGARAMQGNRHPIRQIGFRNLIVEMQKVARHDREHGECEISIERNVLLNGRSCTVIQALHPVERSHFEFHKARIYIDDALNLPVAYEGFLWPQKTGDDPPLLEKYYYTDIELNVGLKDLDFDPANPDYDFPGK